MATHNQFQTYLPNELATAIRADVKAGKYVIKDVLRDALALAHQGIMPTMPVTSDSEIAAHLETARAMLVDAGYPDGDGGITEPLGALISDARQAERRAQPQLSVILDPETGLDQRSVEWQAIPQRTPPPVAFFAPAVGEPTPQRAQWFASKAELDQWLLDCVDRGERIESISYDPTGGSILALVTDVVVRP